MTHSKLPSLIVALQNPALYPHEIEYFKLIETHISWVLLTGQYTYKIKKPLNLGFLDFSNLEKRKHFCFEELRLNSRLAPDVYLDVVTISGTEQTPKLDGACTAIEYAVKMRQFELDSTFDLLLTNNQLTSEHIKQTAKIIAAFHSRIKKAEVDTEFGSFNAVINPVRENFSQILKLDGIEKTDTLKKLASWSEQQHVELLKFFNQRKQNGFIRECHGDLHLGNIALDNDRVVPFDCLEFNPSLYWIDVISEIAFLVMDLQDKQRHDLAFQFLNNYLQISGDYEGLIALRFYLVYRAVVLAKVNAIRSTQSSSADDQHKSIDSYHRYLNLAVSYTLPSKPQLIIMQGVSGSGKSWLSEQIISRYQAIRVRSDVERKRLQSLSAQQNSHSGLGDNLYSQTNTDITYQNLLQRAIQILNAGYNVIVDATFLQQKQRKQFSLQAEKLQVPFLIINTYANKPTLINRIKSRAKKQDNVSEADQTVLMNQLQNLQPLSNEEQKNSIAIDTGLNIKLTELWKFLDDRYQALT